MDEEYEKAAKESESENTALLPASFFPHSPEVGKTCKVKVVHVYEDEIEVEYVDSKEEKSESTMDAEIDRVAQES